MNTHRSTLYICLFILILLQSVAISAKEHRPSELPYGFADLAEKVTPAVVNISTTTTLKTPGGPFIHFFGLSQRGPIGDLLRRFLGGVPERELKEKSLGSGFIIDKDGYILTNNHVVDNAQEIKVKLSDGREFYARVIGKDPKTDLALVRIHNSRGRLPIMVLGDSGKVRVGDWVLAIGNPFGLEHTVTQGIISATGRLIGAGPYEDFLQTDAPINPGNSGGPLINMKGEAVGINSVILASGQGIGFAIPSNMARNIALQLREKGHVTRGWLGISVSSASAGNTGGAMVTEVVPRGPAALAGVEKGDIIIKFGDRQVNQAQELPAFIAETPVGETVPVEISRSGKLLIARVRVAEMP